ncbi:MAG: sensor histidine kinase, partial [Rhizomicrobium sp.]
VAPAIPHVRADRRRLRQVLINLLSNAIKFTPEGGKVIVRARRASGGVVIDVCDTGIGIAQEDIPRAMEYFGQVDSTLARRYEGSGLGLPLSRQIMELHGGKLVLRSKPGEGTTVTLSLPETRLLDGRKAAA